MGRNPAVEVDAAALAIHDLRHLGRLRQREAVAHRGQIGRGRLAPAVPADLLHAVIELDAVSVGIEHVERPVAAGKIAAEPADGHLALREILVGIGDFLERADLERDLVHEHAVLVMRLAHALGGRGVNGGERMVVGAVRGEHCDRLAVALDRVGVAKSEHVDVEPARHVEIGLPQREVPEPSRFERTRQQDTADIVHAGLGIHGWRLPTFGVSIRPNS